MQSPSFPIAVAGLAALVPERRGGKQWFPHQVETFKRFTPFDQPPDDEEAYEDWLTVQENADEWEAWHGAGRPRPLARWDLTIGKTAGWHRDEHQLWERTILAASSRLGLDFIGRHPCRWTLEEQHLFCACVVELSATGSIGLELQPGHPRGCGCAECERSERITEVARAFVEGDAGRDLEATRGTPDLTDPVLRRHAHALAREALTRLRPPGARGSFLPSARTRPAGLPRRGRLSRRRRPLRRARSPGRLADDEADLASPLRLSHWLCRGHQRYFR